MRSRRRVWILAVTAMLLVIDPLAAARAGAGMVPAPAHAIVNLPRRTRPLDRIVVSREIVSRRIVSRRIGAHKIAAHKVSRRKVTTHVRARRGPTRGPTMCEAVVATIAWPRGWVVGCDRPRPGLLGLTNPNGTTRLYVRADESLSTMHVVALHEAGHAWDLARLDRGRIAQWCARRGCDAARFFSGGSGGPGWGQPGGAEDWAAVWDACHGGDYHRSYLGLPAPAPADCALQDALVGYGRAPADAR